MQKKKKNPAVVLLTLILIVLCINTLILSIEFVITPIAKSAILIKLLGNSSVNYSSGINTTPTPYSHEGYHLEDVFTVSTKRP